MNIYKFLFLRLQVRFSGKGILRGKQAQILFPPPTQVPRKNIHKLSSSEIGSLTNREKHRLNANDRAFDGPACPFGVGKTSANLKTGFEFDPCELNKELGD